MSAPPTLAWLLRRVAETTLAESYTAMPARVESYDATEQRMSVTPSLKRAVIGDESTEIREFPRIDNAPVCFPRGGGAFVSMPIEQGDYVLLVVCDRSLDIWLEKGGVVDPIDLRRHAITDAVAIPGVYPNGEPIGEDGLADNLVLGIDGGSTIHVKPNGEIHLGSENAADFVALATETQGNDDDILQLIKDLSSAINGWTPVAQDGGAALKVALTSWIASVAVAMNSDVAASKVKAD